MYDLLIEVGDEVKLITIDKTERETTAAMRQRALDKAAEIALEIQHNKRWSVKLLSGLDIHFLDGSKARMLGQINTGQKKRTITRVTGEK